MEPYYQDDMVALYLGDCRDVTEWLGADVLVTDPPYGRGALNINISNRSLGHGRGNVVDRSISGDESTEARDAVLTLWKGRPAVVFGDLRIAAPPGVGQVLIYRKPSDSGMRSTAGFRRDVEAIYLMGIPAEWGGRSSVIETSTSKINGQFGPAGRYGHAHAKPVDVMEQLVDACPPGVIADPFAGSGSTLVAARNLGHRAIGVEIDERYCETIARRLAQDVLPIA